MLKQRIITAMILLILTGLALFVVPEIGFVSASWLLCLIGIHELTKMYKFDLANQVGLIIILTMLAGLLYFSHYDLSQVIRITAILTWCFLVPFILIWHPKEFSKFAICIIATLVFVPAFYALVQLYDLLGPWRLLSIMAIAWVADIGAYFIGKQFGHRKLAPQISPGKSIEGAIGGLILVIIYLLILKTYANTVYLYSYGAVFKVGFILTTVGILGDLFESWLKRVAKIKDSGTILPGHGGMFDRIDSLVAVLAVAFALIWGVI